MAHRALTLFWLLRVTSGMWYVGGCVQVIWAHSAWSLQILAGVPGASLPVDIEGKRYTVFNSP